GPETPTPEDGEGGRDGEDGENGNDGRDGQDGRDGRDGRDGEDGEDGNDGSDRITTPEFEEANARLDAARTKLAEIRAGREARTLHIPGRGFTKKDLREALDEYNQAIKDVGVAAAEILQQEGIDPTNEEHRHMINWGAAVEVRTLAEEQRDVELANFGEKSPAVQKFYNFWARHSQARMFSLEGAKNMAIKSGVMAVPGIPLGIGIGILAAPVAATGAAGAAGAYLATRVSRAMVGAKISKEAGMPTLAAQKAEGRINKLNDAIDAIDARKGDTVNLEKLDKQYEQDTSDVVGQNRKRAAKAAGMAAVVGTASALVVDHFHGGGGNHPDEPNNGNGGGNTPENGGGGNHPDEPNNGNGGGNTPENGGGGNTPEHNPFDDMTPEQLDAFRRYVEWSDNFKAQNPTMVTPGGNTVNVGTEAYWNEMQRRWDEWFSPRPAAPATPVEVQPTVTG
ncbi:hypothetical protein KDA00_05885, partial [Candidatus Saccharibacteria bacterium]|nr:hypothetical protein [Candidatus Saccharibacteria bacterium]